MSPGVHAASSSGVGMRSEWRSRAALGLAMITNNDQAQAVAATDGRPQSLGAAPPSVVVGAVVRSLVRRGRCTGGGSARHAFADGHPGSGLIGYVVVFAAIWWAWVAFTWFANVFDTDDVPYRLLMIVMIAGSLGLAAGVPKIFALDFRVASWRTSSCDSPMSVSGCAFFGPARTGGDRSPRRSSC